MIGTTLLHYRILSLLGSGGMSKVYLAFDETSGREVAVKVVPSRHGDAQRRLLQEARALAELRHPNIVTLHAVEEHQGRTLLVMERIDGESLADRVRPGGLDIEAFRAMALPVVEGIAAAHERGILHRDLKTGNVMVHADGRVQVLDFGLAENFRPEADGRTATDVPTVVGTLPYMAPEMVEGKAVDPRSDVFSLGILLHELATGSRPFQGDNVTALMVAILRGQRRPAPFEPSLPAALPAIVDRCLQPLPADRFADACALRTELRRAFAAAPSLAARFRRTIAGWLARG
jgi:serine/threonine protein kinase